MADADVPITAGSGTKIDTRTVGAGSDEHRQVVVLGDPATAAGVAGVDAANGVDVDVTRSVRVIAASATLSSVNDTASSTTILASNADRRGVLIDNNSTQELKIKYGGTASATSYSVRIPAGWQWEMPEPIYTGTIDGIWTADGTGAAFITELE